MLVTQFVRRVVQRGFSLTKPTTLEDDYEILSCLGQGSTSRVYNAIDVRTNEKVIVKLFKKIMDQKIERESRVLKLVRGCPNVQQLKEIIQNHGFMNYGFVFHYYPGGMMNSIMKEITLEDTRLYVRQILMALQCIHGKGIMHRDVKPSNILISNDPDRKQARLIDFGLAEVMTTEQIYKYRVGTNCYKPPQVLLKRTTYNQKVDIWSLGVILAELLLGVKPLFKYVENQKQMMERVFKKCNHASEAMTTQQMGLYGRPPRYQGIKQSSKSDRGLKLALRMMDFNPSRRPSAEEALGDQFFKQ